MLKTFQSLTIILFLFGISFQQHTLVSTADAVKEIPIEKWLPSYPELQKRQMEMQKNGASKAVKHRDDLLKGKWDNPALDALFNKIRTEHEGYEFPDGSTFEIGTREGPNAPEPWTTVDCGYAYVSQDALRNRLALTFCPTNAQLYHCDVDIEDPNRDITMDLVRGGKDLAKCFCKFASRNPETPRFGEADYSNIVPGQYEDLCSAILGR